MCHFALWHHSEPPKWSIFSTAFMKPSTWDLIVGHESYRCRKSGILRWSNGLVVVKKRLTPKIADLQEVPNGHKAQQSMLCCSYFSSGPQRAPTMHVHYLGLSMNMRYQGFVIIYYGLRTRDIWIFKILQWNTCQKDAGPCLDTLLPPFWSNGWFVELKLCIFWKSIERWWYDCFLVFIAPPEL